MRGLDHKIFENFALAINLEFSSSMFFVILLHKNHFQLSPKCMCNMHCERVILQIIANYNN